MFNKQDIPVPGGAREQIRRLEQAVKDALAKAEAAKAEVEDGKRICEYWVKQYDRLIVKMQDNNRVIGKLRENNEMLLRDMLRLQGPQAPQGVGGDADDMLFREGAEPIGGRRGQLGQPVVRPVGGRAHGFQQDYEDFVRRENERQLRIVEQAAAVGRAAGARVNEARNRNVRWDADAAMWLGANGAPVNLQQQGQANDIVQDVVNDLAARAERVVWDVMNEHEDVQVLRVDPEPQLQDYDPAPPEDEGPVNPDW